MAPEMCGNVNSDSKGHTFAADVYSFGMCLFELLSLDKPYSEVDPAEKWQLASQGILPELPEDLDPSYDPIIEIFFRCCRENPAKRPSVKKIKSKLVENM
jgi:serine/threonine protein kinase